MKHSLNRSQSTRILFVGALALGLVLSFGFADHAHSKDKKKSDKKASKNSDSERKEPEFYNEIFAPDGTIREQYRPFVSVYKKMRMADRKAFVEQSLVLFRGDNALHPIPRVLTHSEFETIRKGTQQRGDALRLFLQDHYSGKRNYLKEEIIPQSVVEHIMRRTGDWGYEGQVRPEQISFIYGPDIVRGPDGLFHVIEDNTGYVGGLGDLALAREALFKLKQQYQSVAATVTSPEDFYKNLINRYRDRGRALGEEIVLFQIPPYSDNEDQRIAAIFKKLGVTLVTPNTKEKLTIEKNGEVFVARNGDPSLRRKVGFVILFDEHFQIDPSHPVTRQRSLLNEARYQLEDPELENSIRKEIKKAMKPDRKTDEIDLDRLALALKKGPDRQSYVAELKKSQPGLIESIFAGKVATNYLPGVDFVGDKEFYTYVEELIRFYLHEEPILTNLPTRRFADFDKKGRASTNEKLMRKVFKKEKRWRRSVIKTVDGRGGDGVWIGSKIDFKQAEDLEKKVRAAPDRFIVQEFTPLSRMETSPKDSLIVDLRFISDVGPDSTLVSSVPWARGISADGDGKVNISGSGRDLAVLVVDDPPTPELVPNDSCVPNRVRLLIESNEARGASP